MLIRILHWECCWFILIITMWRCWLWYHHGQLSWDNQKRKPTPVHGKVNSVIWHSVSSCLIMINMHHPFIVFCLSSNWPSNASRLMLLFCPDGISRSRWAFFSSKYTSEYSDVCFSSGANYWEIALQHTVSIDWSGLDWLFLLLEELIRAVDWCTSSFMFLDWFMNYDSSGTFKFWPIVGPLSAIEMRQDVQVGILFFAIRDNVVCNAI